MSFQVKIWGARGSIPVASPDHMKFGGSTACVELDINGHKVIIDAGSGIRELGMEIMEKGIACAHLLISHGHYDHVMGLPFFYPVYKTDMQLDIWSGHTNGNPCTRNIIAGFMQEPYLPVNLDLMHANMVFHDIKEAEQIDLGNGISATTCSTNHPGGCLAWRVTDGSKSVVYWSDHEHGDKSIDDKLTAFSKDADILLYDAMYTDKEYPSKVGFGHSTWRKACEFAASAKAKQLLLFHHSPERTDRQMEAIEADAAKIFPGTRAAHEGQIIKLS